eukprot:TRINITY_DN73824_c0_g1_i1.p1 TRINITY_DN73824_c0_g1~~TRINITY_DN73824_c0_g1_i1.p1  ORF type:complete len:105 (+),score=3.76 TRINITY_DN73824_c0_g1_i1:358-672(+)
MNLVKKMLSPCGWRIPFYKGLLRIFGGPSPLLGGPKDPIGGLRPCFCLISRELSFNSYDPRGSKMIVSVDRKTHSIDRSLPSVDFPESLFFRLEVSRGTNMFLG